MTSEEYNSACDTDRIQMVQHQTDDQAMAFVDQFHCDGDLGTWVPIAVDLRFRLRRAHQRLAALQNQAQRVELGLHRTERANLAAFLEQHS